MRHAAVVLCSMFASALATVSMAQEVTICSFNPSGQITWSNTYPFVTAYRVEWAPSPGGPWTGTWDALGGIPASQSVMTAVVPVCYRVVGAVTGLTEGLALHYKLNGDFLDAGPLSNHGTAFGPTATTDRFGNATGALNFDGTSDYGSIPQSAALNCGTGDFTVVVWMKVTNDQIPSASRLDNSVMEKWNDNLSVSYPFNLRINNHLSTAPGVVHAHRYSGTGVGFALMSTNSLADGQWHQAGIVKLGGNIDFYIDAALHSSHEDTLGNAATNTTPLIVGRRSASNGQYFRGSLDTLLIYQRALSQQELAALLHLVTEL